MKPLIISFFTICFFSIGVIAQKNSENPILKASIERGNEIYNDFCMQCHLPNGQGVENTIPPLANSDYLMEKREESIKGIKFGLKGEIVVNNVTYNSAMTSMGLDDEEIADVMNFITNSWGNINNKIVTKEEVSKIKK